MLHLEKKRKKKEGKSIVIIENEEKDVFDYRPL